MKRLSKFAVRTGAFVLVAATVALLAGPAAAAWIDLGGPEPVSVRVLESDGSRTVYEITVGGFDVRTVTIDGEEYYLVDLPREGLEMAPGLPQLPNVRRSLIIPDDREMGLRVLDSDHVDLADMPIAPSKGHLLRSVDPETVPYAFDAYYQTGGYYPAEIVTADEPHILRDYRGQVVDANVFRYDAGSRTLRVYTRLVIEVAPVGPGRVNVLDRRGPVTRHDPQFAGLYENHFINFQQDTRYVPLEEDGSLLIIAYEAFAPYMQPLIEWKNQKGIATRMVTLAETGPTYNQIFSYIQNEYETTDLAYVLLVGDAQHVPKYGSDSDPGYSCLAGGDNYPEIFVGRFSAETPQDVQTQVQRTITYERDTPAGAGSDWTQSGTGIASNEGPGHFGEYDNEHMDLIRDDLLAFGYDQVDQYYQPYATAAQVASSLNAGRGNINYCGHGSQNAWTTSGFNNANVNNLVNDDMLPFIISVACNNGTFTGGTCFAEAWLRATNAGQPTGAIATYMSYISQSWQPPMYGQDEAIDLLIADAKRTVGGLWFNGSCHMMDATGASGQNEFRNWMIFGDPSVCVRTKTAQAMAVDHAGVVFLGADTFELDVPGVEGALCALYADGVLYGTGTTDAAGHAVVTMAAPPAGPMDITLTVTAYNMQTVVQTLPVISPSVVIIEPATVPCGVPTEVTITVFEADGVTPIPDVDIDVRDEMAFALQAVTDRYGVAAVTVDYPYGTTLQMIGLDASAGFLFERGLAVTAQPLVEPDLSVVTDPGIEGIFVLNLPSVLTATSGTPDVGVRAMLPDGTLLADAGGVLAITPTVAGEITAWVVKDGYDLHREVFPVVTDPSIHGRVTVEGETDFSGVLVTAEPGGYTTTTAPDGSYHLLGLEAGTYTVTAELAGWTTGLAEGIELAEGVHVTEVDFDLLIIVMANRCEAPELAVPDYGQASATMNCPEQGTVDWVRVYVDISHQWISALQVELTSPEGSTILLHNRTGGSGDDIVGWYPEDIEPDGNLDAFLGESIHGDWTLTVRDLAYNYVAVLNEWCLQIGYGGTVVAVESGELPTVLALDANFPNPFNPRTTIGFALPRASRVSLAVFDLRGRLVRTLVDGELPAGRHEAVWAGQDEAGRQAASGLYVYRLRTDGQDLTRKMLLLK